MLWYRFPDYGWKAICEKINQFIYTRFVATLFSGEIHSSFLWIFFNQPLFIFLYYRYWKLVGNRMAVNFNLLLTFILLFVFTDAQNSTTTLSNSSNITVDTNQSANTATVPPVWLQRSATELETFMSDRYNYFLTPGGNKVWVCTMNLAWN